MTVIKPEWYGFSIWRAGRQIGCDKQNQQGRQFFRRVFTTEEYRQLRKHGVLRID